jgi:tRNA G18 (ribose-2'-O)-methylase SpoU
MEKRTAKENLRLKGGLRTLKKNDRNEICVILDNIKSMENVGAIFRTCDGARVKKIYLCGITATPPRDKIGRISMGAVDWVDWEYFQKTEDAIAKLKNDGFSIVALEQTNQSQIYSKVDYPRPIAIILGHEKNGVSKGALELCDMSAEIPMHGRANSLNVATSAGIILYQILER